jgi:phage gpG-like protein
MSQTVPNSGRIRNILSNLPKSLLKIALPVIEQEGLKSFDKNFDDGGREPAWTPSKKIGTTAEKKHGNKTLIDHGYLRKIQSKIEDERIVYSNDPRTSAYAEIQQSGGKIHKEKSTKLFRKGKSKDYKHKEGSYRPSLFASSKHKHSKEKDVREHDINIEARPYMKIPKGDDAGILERTGKAILKFLNSLKP